eukprot:XP_001703908.1 Hypothetical protein GL50803_18726 [Giardia lamblia ATCC 50803]
MKRSPTPPLSPHTPHSTITITITVQHSLPKSRLPSTYEPPAEEAHEAPHNDDHGDGDPRDGPCAEAAPVGARGHTGGPTAVRAVSIVAHTDRVIISGVAGAAIHA